MKNKINELIGKDWIKFTKTWFIHRPGRRKENEILHPAKYPESLVSEFIKFFTKQNEWVLDPFLGTGSTLLAASGCKRNGIGIELSKKYSEIARDRLRDRESDLWGGKQFVIQGNSIKLISLLKENNLLEKKINFCITSPPYWNQLKKNQIRQKHRREKGIDTKYSEDKADIGNIDDYDKFIQKQAEIFDLVYEVVADKSYLVIITNNVFSEGKLYPLAYDTATSLTNRNKKSWVLKDEKIWCQDDKALLPLGIYNAWVGNRCHQYCLIFRKEKL